MHYFEIVFWAHTKEGTSERVPFISTWTLGSANFFFSTRGNVVRKLKSMFAHQFALSYILGRFRGNVSILQLELGGDVNVIFLLCVRADISFACLCISTPWKYVYKLLQLCSPPHSILNINNALWHHHGCHQPQFSAGLILQKIDSKYWIKLLVAFYSCYEE